AFNAVAVESVSEEAVLSGDDRNLGFERRLLLPLQRIAAPDFDQCAVSEQPQIARANRRRLIHRSRLADLELHLDRATRSPLYIGARKIDDWLSPVFLRHVPRGSRAFTRRDVGEQTGVEELVEEDFDRRDVEDVVWREAPEYLSPCARRPVEQAVRRHHQPIGAAVERNERRQRFATRDIPQTRAAVVAARDQELAVGAEGQRFDAQRMAVERHNLAPRRSLPQLDYGVVSGRSQQSGVGAEGGGANICGMTGHRSQFTASRRIPKLDRITEQAGVALDGVNVGEVYAGARFVLGRREEAAVGAPGHAVNPEAAGERERE